MNRKGPIKGSDDGVRRATGRDRSEWFTVLDRTQRARSKAKTFEVTFEVQVTFCDDSGGEGTRCDAPGGSPNLTGTWCCPRVYDCTEEPPLACEPV